LAELAIVWLAISAKNAIAVMRTLRHDLADRT
jgi:hypothetical protein